MLCMLLLCFLFFKFTHKAYLNFFPMVILYFSTRRLVTSADFPKAPSSSTITRLHGWFSLFNIFGMNQMIVNGDCLDTFGNIQIIIVFEHNTVIIEVKPLTEVTLYKENYMRRISPGLRLVV